MIRFARFRGLAFSSPSRLDGRFSREVPRPCGVGAGACVDLEMLLRTACAIGWVFMLLPLRAPEAA